MMLASFLPAASPQQAMRQVVSDQQNVLTEIFADDVNLVIWQRQLCKQLQPYAAALRDFTALQGVATPEELLSLLSQRLPHGVGKDQFIHDIVLMAQMLCCLMDCAAVGFRLKSLQSAMCPRFHTDHIALRLLVTYDGVGTEWFAENQTENRCATNNDNIRQIDTGHVALLKGSAWQPNAGGAIWHRSPHSNQPRLLLSMDPIGD